ncbi:MAG TPA: hypothetical protein VI643_04735 [Planctomycetota bacterium]|nr:hypothetical protein [Planctomycetota bacterium]
MSFLILLLAAIQDVSVHADHGWGSRFRPHFWSPVRISVDNDGKAFEGSIKLRWAWMGANQGGIAVRLEDLDGADGPVYEIPVVLPERSRRVYTAYVRAPGQLSLWVGVEPKEGKPLKPFEILGNPAAFHRPFVAVVGRRLPEGLREAGNRSVELALAQPETLPDRWIGYAPVDALVWYGADASKLQDASQGEALRRWVAAGGHLVVAADNLVGISNTFLEELIPIEPGSPAHGKPPAELARFGGIPLPAGDAFMLRCMPSQDARVIVPGAIFRGTFGRGRVTFVAFDPSKDPFKDWEGGVALWNRLLQLRVPNQEGFERWGYTGDLAMDLGSRALGSAAFSFPGIPMPSLGWIFWLIFLYVLLVGPVDYYVLRRLRRQELTWITFPAYVIGFSVLAVMAAGASARRLSTAREMAVMDVMPDAEQTNLVSIGSLLTPVEADLDLSPDLPGGAAVPLSSGSLHYGSDSRSIEGARILETDRVLTQGCFMDRGSTTVWLEERCESGAAKISFEIQGGTLVVSNGLGSTVTDAKLVTPDGVLSVGDLPPGRVTLSNLKPSTRFWEGVSPQSYGALGGNPDSNYYIYGRFGDVGGAEDDIRARIQTVMMALAVPANLPEGAILTGPARSIDVRPWLEDGGSVLIGWLDSPGFVRIGAGVRPERSAHVMVRVFSK